MGTKWTAEQRARFKATMAAKRAAKAARRNAVRHSPHTRPDVIYTMVKGGRLVRLHLRTMKVYVPE